MTDKFSIRSINDILTPKSVREWYAFCGGEELGISLEHASVVWDAATKAAKKRFAPIIKKLKWKIAYLAHRKTNVNIIKLLEKQKDLDPEISGIINDNFWKLLDQ